MWRFTKYYMEQMTLNCLYKELDEYKTGKLDAYIGMFGKSEGLNAFLYDEYGKEWEEENKTKKEI